MVNVTSLTLRLFCTTSPLIGSWPLTYSVKVEPLGTFSVTTWTSYCNSLASSKSLSSAASSTALFRGSVIRQVRWSVCTVTVLIVLNCMHIWSIHCSP